MLAGLQEIKRLKEDPAELLQVAQNFSMLGIIVQRQLGRILKRRVQVQLKSNLHYIARAGFYIERVVIEIHFAHHDHAQGLFGGKCMFEIQSHRHSLILPS